MDLYGELVSWKMNFTSSGKSRIAAQRARATLVESPPRFAQRFSGEWTKWRSGTERRFKPALANRLRKIGFFRK